MTRASLAGLLALLLVAAPARADVPGDVVRDGLAALAEFRALSPDGAAALPRLADPTAGPVLRRLWNVAAVVDGRPQGATGAQELLQWSGGSLWAVQRYLALGMGAASPGEGEARLLLYQDEMTLGLAFLFRSTATVLGGLTAQLAALPPEEADTPARRQGLAQMAGGVVQMSQGIMQLARTPGMGVGNARVLSGALVADLPLLLPVLPEPLRAAIAAQAGAGDGHQDPQVRADLESVRRLTAGG